MGWGFSTKTTPTEEEDQVAGWGPGAPRSVSAESEAELRSLLTEQELQECDDETMVCRYLRATESDAEAAAKRIRDTLQWRREQRPDQLICTACVQDPSSHFMHIVGSDLWGRPTIYSCLALATNRIVEDNRKHMIVTFEQAIRLMPPGVTSWNWVCDFTGFSLSDCDPRIAKVFLSLSAHYYPERLGNFLVVSAPTLFNGLWKALSPFVDPYTKQKIHFEDYSRKANNRLAALLRASFGPETASWLLQEMGENRDKAVLPSKTYSYPDLSLLASAVPGSEELQQEAERRAALRRSKSTTKAHDHLGAPQLLGTLSGRPELLLDHLAALSLEAPPA